MERSGSLGRAVSGVDGASRCARESVARRCIDGGVMGFALFVGNAKVEAWTNEGEDMISFLEGDVLDVTVLSARWSCSRGGDLGKVGDTEPDWLGRVGNALFPVGEDGKESAFARRFNNRAVRSSAESFTGPAALVGLEEMYAAGRRARAACLMVSFRDLLSSFICCRRDFWALRALGR